VSRRRAQAIRDRTAESATRAAGDLLIAALERLDARLRGIVLFRFFALRTLDELAEMYGVTRERVRQIEYQAILKLREDNELVSLLITGEQLGRHRSVVLEKYPHLEWYAREREERELEMFEQLYEWRHGTCEKCGKEFDRGRDGRPRRFCSNSCRQAAYRAGKNTDVGHKSDE
jgi:sigma-70-like protein